MAALAETVDPVSIPADLRTLIVQAQEEAGGRTALPSGFGSPSERDGMLGVDGRIWIPDGTDEVHRAVFKLVHEHPALGAHGARQSTLDAINRLFVWRRARPFVTRMADACASCQRIRPPNRRPQGLAQPHAIPPGPGHTVAIDFVSFPEYEGYDQVFVVVDEFSKERVYAPTKSTATATDVAELFCEHWVRRCGVPAKIVLDRDPRFRAAVFKSIAQRLGIDLAFTSGYAPQSNGMVERVHRQLHEALSHYVDPEVGDWPTFLWQVELAHNTRPHKSTALAPFELTRSYRVRSVLPSPFQTGELRGPLENEELREQAYAALERAAERSATQMNRGRRQAETYTEGDLVYIHRDGLGRARARFEPLYVGPFPVERMQTAKTVRVVLPQDEFPRKNPVFNVQHVKRYIADDEHDDQAHWSAEQITQAHRRPTPARTRELDRLHLA